MFTTVMYRDTGIMTWGQMGHVYNCYVQGHRDHDLGTDGTCLHYRRGRIVTLSCTEKNILYNYLL